MANESNYTLTYNSTVSGVTAKCRVTGNQSRTNPEYYQGAILASATHVQLAITGTITEDTFVVKNEGDTNVVHLQTSNSGSTGRFATIKPGGLTVVQAASATSYYAVCESGQSSVISVTILSD